MNIYINDNNGSLRRHDGKSLIVEFDEGNALELTEFSNSLLPEASEGINVCVSGKHSEFATGRNILQLNITPLAGNCVLINPYRLSSVNVIEVEIFIAGDNKQLYPLNGKSVVIELDNGKTLEVMEDYTKKGLLVWGGREPILGLPLEKAKERTESLGLFPIAANIVHVFPFKFK